MTRSFATTVRAFQRYFYFVRYGEIEVPVRWLRNEHSGVVHAQADGPAGRSGFGIRTVCSQLMKPSDVATTTSFGEAIEPERDSFMTCERCAEDVIRRKVKR